MEGSAKRSAAQALSGGPEAAGGGGNASASDNDGEGDSKRACTDLRSRVANTRSEPGNIKKIDQAWKEVFGHLKLEDVSLVSEIGKTRPRNHVNPLASQFLSPVEPPKWAEIFEDTSKPLFIDVGCAQGRFGLLMATNEKWKDWNHLGIEIRAPHVTRANAWAERKGLKNVHYVSCSANSSLGPIISSYPGTVEWVAVQFPDPHFKRKHHKRRVVQPAFLEDLARHSQKGCKLFMQSDIEEVVAQMRDRTDGCSFFDRVGTYTPRDEALDPEICRNGADDSLWTKSGQRAEGKAIDFGDWLEGPNPVGVPTEREVQNQALDLPVYRCLFERNDRDVPPPSLNTTVSGPKPHPEA
ncbi:tRNA guanine-N7--methyltransferase [Hondaea fermentalgiana]|uniref:tRNA (guanine(46)-N(7))-methyltransferase n=1 Tax=Hondaea fermentalgiana TaxID=2315210 RepID=A0A2R5G6Z8_9STRA|nr:tRNA guanine-N7--methyltransferase [Hondaea fermentalgiana]|eukprot:GBG26836.1 tRNA guanine-N7--methyltransferase [Hondaea fermentalgiana]